MKNKLCRPVILLASLAALLGACSDNSNSEHGYDGRAFDISAAQDGSLKLTSTKTGSRYNLHISGTGASKNFARKEEAPWYPLAKFVDNVEIDEGITNIGDHYFDALTLDYYILPSTVESVGDHSFNTKAIVYTKGSTITNISNDVYYYSESEPTSAGNYFYLENGEPKIWDTFYNPKSFLFIGNSFTYKQGTTEDQAVPRYFAGIANNLGHEVIADFVVEGSYKLASYADPNDALGAVVEQKLTTNKYDVVILQEQSTTPLTNYATFVNAVKKLKKRIDETQNNCRTYLYETWGSPTAIQSTISGKKYATVGEMEADLRTAYTNAGIEAECYVNYIGKAFTYVVENLPGSNIYAEDNRHQSNIGAYLSAACHVRSIFKDTVKNCTYYADLDQNSCKSMLNVADTVC